MTFRIAAVQPISHRPGEDERNVADAVLCLIETYMSDDVKRKVSVCSCCNQDGKSPLELLSQRRTASNKNRRVGIRQFFFRHS